MTLHWVPSPTGGAGVLIRNEGVDVGTRPAINLHPGSGISITATDDAANGEVDVTVSASLSGLTHQTGTRTSGDVTVSSTSWAAVDTGLDIAIPASIGDVLELTISALFSNASPTANNDVGIVVSGSVASRASGSSNGVGSWNVRGSNYFSAGGAFFYTVQSGDLASGEITLRWLAKLETSGSRTLYASSTAPAQFSALNRGAPS